jgi:hypothetical protein
MRPARGPLLRGGSERSVCPAYPARAEDVSVGKVLCSQVTNGQAREHNLGATLGALGELIINDVPLCRGSVLPQKSSAARQGPQACASHPSIPVPTLQYHPLQYHSPASTMDWYCVGSSSRTSAFSFSDLSSNSMFSSRMEGSWKKGERRKRAGVECQGQGHEGRSGGQESSAGQEGVPAPPLGSDQRPTS